MKILTNGEYFMIRRGFWPFYEYADKSDIGTWWSNFDLFSHYILMDLHDALYIYRQLEKRKKKFVVVKFKELENGAKILNGKRIR